MSYAEMNASEQGSILYRTARIGAERGGYEVRKAKNTGGAQIVDLVRDGKSMRVAIRTSRNRWVAFVPLAQGAWKTLDDVEAVLVVTADDFEQPKAANIYLFPADDVRRRFVAAFATRTTAGHQIELGGFGIWISLDQNGDELYGVGSGLAQAYRPISTIPFAELVVAQPPSTAPVDEPVMAGVEVDAPLVQALMTAPETLTIADILRQARQQIADVSGVMPEAVKLDLKIES